MTAATGALVLVNVLMALFGLGLITLLGVARTPRELLARAPLAYAVGLATSGLLGSALELLHAPLGPLELSVLAVASLAGGAFKLLTGAEVDAPATRPSWPSLATGLLAFVLALALVLHAAYAYSVRPLREYDGWVIWATKARALYAHDGVRDTVFASGAYAHPDYPILLPTLEAIGFRAMGEFDGTLLHLQLAGLALAFVAAAWTISRAAASPLVAGLGILAAVSAPTVLTQLGWNYADVPLAMFSGLGVAALAAWLRVDATWLLTVAVVFLAAGASTKSEGVMFSLAALSAAALVLVASRRTRIRHIVVASAALVAAILPWRLYVLAHDLRPQDYALSDLASPSFLADASGRLQPAATELLRQMTSTSNWGFMLPLVGLAFLAALLRGRYDVAGFGALWLALSFGGLMLIYWINELPLGENLFNTSYRTTVTLMLGGALLVPPLVGELVSGPAGKEVQPSASHS